MIFASHFAPHQDLVEHLLPVISDAQGDGAHDLAHILRVWRNVQRLMAQEGGDGTVLVVATLLHDCVDVPKDAPDRRLASRFAADKAAEALAQLGWAQDRIDRVTHAVEAHSFSADVAPRTLEAKILQDADRLDAMGHIGIARCFYVSGRLGRALYDPQDPLAQDRDLDDIAFAADHFQTKLLRLAGSFQTETGNRVAAERHLTLQRFLNGMLQEIGSDP